MKPERIYKFACGNIGLPKLIHKKRVCPDCDAKIIGRLEICQKCGIDFFGNVHGRANAFCKKCQTDARRARQRAYDKTFVAKNKAEVRISSAKAKVIAEKDAKIKAIRLKIAENAADREKTKTMRVKCLFFDHCLKFDLKDDPNACTKCEEYVYKHVAVCSQPRKKSGANPLGGQK